MSDDPGLLLRALYGRIDARAASVSARIAWPCRRGCDRCCRRLARPPHLTAPEWQALRVVLEGLDPTPREGIAVRVEALAWDEARCPPPRHFTCPLLDPEEGACLAYAGRPAACRTYGFYLDRGQGFFCSEVLALQGSPAAEAIVWGNQEAIEAELVRIGGPARSLVEWFRETRG